MISIYRKVEDEAMNQSGIYFEQAFIKFGEQIPEGWTTDLESVQPPDKPSELEQLKLENEKLKNRVEEMAAQQSLTDGAIMDLASMVLTK
ncbi:hypothetical protein [Enterococcus sp. S86.2]|uniref:hypothetical protein n=1 Tax=Enterococcus sp. S86.2 TaxID=3031299 RepID=UPI0026F31859|nr:hypothetical protein [Enterococcus sp. S86.2]